MTLDNQSILNSDLISFHPHTHNYYTESIQDKTEYKGKTNVCKGEYRQQTEISWENEIAFEFETCWKKGRKLIVLKFNKEEIRMQWWRFEDWAKKWIIIRKTEGENDWTGECRKNTKKSYRHLL